jgi:hypothetical protein
MVGLGARASAGEARRAHGGARVARAQIALPVPTHKCGTVKWPGVGITLSSVAGHGSIAPGAKRCLRGLSCASATSCESQKSLQCPAIACVAHRRPRSWRRLTEWRLSEWHLLTRAVTVCSGLPRNSEERSPSTTANALETSRSAGQRSTALTRVCTTQPDNLHTMTLTELEG